VWIDGRLVAESDTPVRPIRVVYDPDVDREVLVECRAPTTAFGGMDDSSELPATARVPSIRTEPQVEAIPPAAIVDLDVEPLPAAETPIFRVTVTVDTEHPLESQCRLSIRPEGFRGAGTMAQLAVALSAGDRSTGSTTVELSDAKLWWPHELGPQHRYTIRASLDSHERTITTGFCHVSDQGDALGVNDQRYRPRGIAIGPTDEPAVVIERAFEANATLVRAHAHVPSHELHRLCDEAGLLVWQDLPLTGPVTPDGDRGREIAAQLGTEFGHHPSIVCWGAHDDPTRPFSGRLGSGRISRARFRWRVWQAEMDRAVPERIAAAFPTDALTVPVSGQPGTDPDAAHLYPGWQYGGPEHLDWVLYQYPSLGRLVGEFGAGSLVEATDDSIPELDRAALEAVTDPTDPDATQRVQARIVKRVAEGLRRNGAAIAVAYRLTDPTPAGGMGICRTDGTGKPALDALGAAFEPVQAVLDGPPEGGVSVTILNDEPRHLEATLRWSAGRHSGQLDVELDPISTADAGAIKVGENADRVTLSLDLEERTVENVYRL
jgi:beta-mannosidase